ncbi:hypothetical protein K2Z84_06325, partial [Candidatus Binatia bacterium]|nr:hypothetical protein [Candidatus Binatia bacterium]
MSARSVLLVVLAVAIPLIVTFLLVAHARAADAPPAARVVRGAVPSTPADARGAGAASAPADGRAGAASPPADAVPAPSPCPVDFKAPFVDGQAGWHEEPVQAPKKIAWEQSFGGT